MPNPKRRHSKTRTAKRRTHDALTRADDRPVPAVPRAEGAAPRLPALRLLPRPRQVRRRSTKSSHRTARIMIRIAVDAMGGDHAPRRIVDGALAAARHLGCGVALVGPRPTHRAELAAHRRLAERWASRSSTRPTSSAWPSRRRAALRRKPRASIRVAAELVARREAAALVSAGHTGATVMAAHAAFGMLPGVDRPALAATIPTRARPGGAARRRRQRRVPAAAPAAVRA